MKIAIIGGGAAGMISAYLLDKEGHQVTVFEKQALLGGNIRTVNKNVKVPGIGKNLFLEGGVIEFSARFHRFRQLMDELEISLQPVNIGTGLFLENGSCYLSRIMIQRNRKGLQKIAAYTRFLNLHIAGLNIWKTTRNLTPASLQGRSINDFLFRKNLATTWVKNFSMYSYSIPFAQVKDIPAKLGISSIKDYMLAGWYRMEGGVYTYIEKILSRFNGTIVLNAAIQFVERNADGVMIQQKDQPLAHFDKVVFATPPDQVLSLLKNPSAAEQKRFGQWNANHATTIIHSDDQIYQKYNIVKPSAFDFFETSNGWGYNACLNQLCAIKKDHSLPYFLAFNLDDYIHPEKIIHTQVHHTPLYTTAAFKYLQEIIDYNGDHHTYHAGAYLGDGLHEGAVKSAERVLALIK